MDIRTIINEADTRIPNAFDDVQKVDWLNEVNHEFFDIVKIPTSFQVISDGVSKITLPTNAREKNLRKVLAGTSYYRSITYENMTAAMNYFLMDDSTRILTLNPLPKSGTGVVVIYDKIGSTSFGSGNLTASPEAPEEYHWLYILGLCSRIGKAQNDVVLANNYETDFKNGLLIAQQNYARQGV